MNVLITGAAGYQARFIVERLRGRHSLRLFDRAPGPGILQGDITSFNDVKAACAGQDAVVHLVALVRGRTGQPLDCRDESAVTQFIRALLSLDVVVNNAGIARFRPLIETPTSELREILEINVVAAFVIMREAARRMVGQGGERGGHIINIASDAAVMGIAAMAPYVASKHALRGMGLSVGLELRAQGVRVTTYCPGPISTEILGPEGLNPKALQPADCAKTIVHIAELPDSIDVQELLVRPTKT